MKRFFLTISILLILVLPGWAATRTISDSGGTRNWNDTETWVEGVVPGIGDTVVATGTSGNLIINVDTNTIGSINLTNYTGTLSGTGYLYVTGNVTFPNGFTNLYAREIKVAGTSTITVGSSQTIYQLGTNGASAAITLGSNLTATGAVYINGGSFNTANYNITTKTFGDHGTGGAKSITLGSSTINITGDSTYFDFGVGSLTITDLGNTAHITVTSTSGSQPTINLGGANWGGAHLTLNTSSTANATAFAGGTIAELTIVGCNTLRGGNVAFSGNMTIPTALTLSGNSQINRLNIKSSVAGTTRTFDLTGATVTATDTDLQDIAYTGSPTITNTRVGDLGGNSGSNTSDAKSVYLGAISANVVWTAGAYYSLTDEASYAERAAVCSLDNFPLAQDTLIVDNKSFSAASKTLTIGNSTYPDQKIGAINASGLTTAETISLYSINVFGSLNLSGSGLTVQGSSTNVFTANSYKNAITITPKTGSTWATTGLTVNTSAGTNAVSLGGNLAPANNCTLTQGILDLNGYSFTVPKFISSNSNSRTLTDSGTTGTLILTGLNDTTNKIFDTTTATNFSVTSAPNIQIGNSALTLTTDVTFMGAGQTYGNFTVKKHAGNFSTIISGANTFGTVTLEAPDATPTYNTVKFPSTTTTTLTSLVADGIADYLINIQPSTAATAATLSDSSGTNTVSYCNIDYVNVEGGATWSALLASGNTVDNATGWTTTSGATLEVTGNLVVGPVTMAGGLSRGPVFAASNLVVGPVTMAGLLHDATMSLTGDMAVGSVTMAGRIQEGDTAFGSGGGLGMGLSPSGNNYPKRGYRK